MVGLRSQRLAGYELEATRVMYLAGQVGPAVWHGAHARLRLGLPPQRVREWVLAQQLAQLVAQVEAEVEAGHAG